MLNFIALWIRLIALIFLAAIAAAIALFFGRKKFNKWEKRITVIVALALVLLGGGSTLKSLISPNVKTIVGTYESEMREAARLSPFEMKYCFEGETETVYLNLDLISKRILFDRAFVQGKEYTITYEINSNLIVAVSETN